jgi:hypothetical protein
MRPTSVIVIVISSHRQPQDKSANVIMILNIIIIRCNSIPVCEGEFGNKFAFLLT